MSQRVWRVQVGGAKYMGLVPHDLSYFQNHFCGSPMSDNWRPPPIQILGKSKKAADFVVWMTSAPVVSERARRTLDPVISDCAQFLDFHAIKGKKYFALNVTKVESDILDLSRSEIFYADGEARRVPVTVKRAVFLECAEFPLPPIFKVSIRGSVMSEIFVTRVFGLAAASSGLTGISLVDPRVPEFPLPEPGDEINDFPGLGL